MSTLSPRLGLKRPDDTDPFLTADFVNNYNILDASPGVFICTSSTRPAWGSAQAGRVIFMTDYKCFQYWDGTTWQNERAATGLYAGGAIFNATLSKNSTTTYNIITLTTPRPATLMILMNATVSCDSQHTQYFSGRIVFDGGDLLLGNYSDAIRFVGDSSNPSADAQMTLPMMAIVNVSAGSHTVGGKIIVGGYNTSLTLRGIKSTAVLGVYASNQIL